MLAKRTRNPLVFAARSLALSPTVWLTYAHVWPGGFATRTGAVSNAFAAWGSLPMALQPRIHRGKIIGAERRQGMTVLPPLGQARNPTPEETTARVERHTTPPLRQSPSRAEALAQLVARLTDSARHRIVSTQTWVKSASPHFDMLAPRLQICVLGDWLQDVVTRLPGARAPGDAQGISFWKISSTQSAKEKTSALSL